MNHYQSEAEIQNVVRGFETCETGADDFKHADHLVVAAWYVHTLGRDAALDRMRAGLIRFLAHHEVDPKKYSETITVFWIDAIDEKLKGLGADASVVDKCRAILAPDFTDRKRELTR